MRTPSSKKIPFPPTNVVNAYHRSISTRTSVHSTTGDRIVQLGVSPQVQRHLYQARAMRNELEELKKRRREAMSALDNEKLAGNSIENLEVVDSLLRFTIIARICTTITTIARIARFCNTVTINCLGMWLDANKYLLK